jgi:hypothetical protein
MSTTKYMMIKDEDEMSSTPYLKESSKRNASLVKHIM